MTERTCEKCPTRFTASRPTQRFCSRKCRTSAANARHRAKRRPPPLVRTCPVCSIAFDHRRSDALTCSDYCARRHNYRPRDNRHTKTCPTCRSTFVSKRSDAVYCSHRCFLEATYDSMAATRRAQKWAAANKEAVRAAHLRYKIKRRNVELASPGVSTRDWLRLLNRHGYRCAYCGERPTKIHMDHVVPLMRGGKHQIGNVLPACAPCNLSKNARLLADWKRGR